MQENLNKSSTIKSQSPPPSGEDLGGGERPYDIIGIGIGPFNLGLAALCDSIKELRCLFFEQNSGFNWHPGLLLPNVRMQVPYYADLVTVADPGSKFTYM